MLSLRLGLTPDADDAFMFFGLVQGGVSIEPYQVSYIVEDIESLNRRAVAGELDMTAISAVVYPNVAQDYRITASGAALARGSGPLVVARQPLGQEGLRGKSVAIPGEFTTAYMLLRIYAPDVAPVPTPFDQIMDHVQSGAVDAGLLIHEGPMTYASRGLTKVVDLGESWLQDTDLPLPLGLNVVHRRLNDEAAHTLCEAVTASIRYAQEHEPEAMKYAQRFGHGLDMEGVRRFVGAFVNEDAVQLGEEGHRALEALYQRAYERGLIPRIPLLDKVGLG